MMSPVSLMGAARRESCRDSTLAVEFLDGGFWKQSFS